MEKSGRFSRLGTMVRDVAGLLLDVQSKDSKIAQTAKELCFLLHYTVADPLNFTPPEGEPTFETRADVEKYILNEKVLLVPRIPPQEERGGFIVIIADDFKLSSNEEFKMNTLTFDVLCHYENWIIEKSLRPFEMMQRIDSIFNNRKLSIGRVKFLTARSIVLTQYLLGYQLVYHDASLN